MAPVSQRFLHPWVEAPCERLCGCCYFLGPSVEACLPLTTDITKALQGLSERAMKMFRMAGDDQCTGGPVDLEGPLGVGGSVLSSLVPRDPLSLWAQSGTGVAHAHPAFSHSALSSSKSPISSSHWAFWCGVAQSQTDPSAWQDGPCLSGRFLWWDSGGNVCFPFLYLVSDFVNISAGPPEVPLVQHLLSPGGLGTPKNMGQRLLCSSASRTPTL